MKTFAIIDLSNMLHRARYAVQGDSFTKAGMALHIVFRSFRKAYRDFGADHIVVCVDGGSWRTKIYPQYKAKRKLERSLRKPSELEEDEIFHQVDADLTSYLDAKSRLTVLKKQYIEADDFVARWIQRHPDDKHIILSGDSDFIQLLGPNVSIYDGVTERTITIDAVTNGKNEKLAFEVNTSTGKLKTTPMTSTFVPEAEWWKLAKFVKIIRGDDGDGVFSAYPGVRYNGSTKRVGIREAWEDRFNRGYHWNNFFQQEWEKLEGIDASGNKIVKKVRVLDEYKINESLIDLTAQPEEIIQIMDAVINTAMDKAPVPGVGLEFMRFCKTHELPNLLLEKQTHALYLNAGYPKN